MQTTWRHHNTSEDPHSGLFVPGEMSCKNSVTRNWSRGIDWTVDGLFVSLILCEKPRRVIPRGAKDWLSRWRPYIIALCFLTTGKMQQCNGDDMVIYPLMSRRKGSSVGGGEVQVWDGALAYFPPPVNIFPPWRSSPWQFPAWTYFPLYNFTCGHFSPLDRHPQCCDNDIKQWVSWFS